MKIRISFWDFHIWDGLQLRMILPRPVSQNLRTPFYIFTRHLSCVVISGFRRYGIWFANDKLPEGEKLNLSGDYTHCIMAAFQFISTESERKFIDIVLASSTMDTFEIPKSFKNPDLFFPVSLNANYIHILYYCYWIKWRMTAVDTLRI